VRIDLRPFRRVEARGAVQASAVFDSENRAFIADMAGFVQAFASNGRLVWRTQLEGSILATPAVDGEGARLFVGTSAGCVYGLATSDGALLWRREIPSQTDPRILSDLLYLPKQKGVVLNSWGGRFHALDAASGESQFSWDAGPFPYAGAAADAEEGLYCVRALRDGGMQFVRVEAGGKESVLYQQAVDEKNQGRVFVAAAPVLDETRRCVCFVMNRGRDAVVHAWSWESGTLLWSRRLSAAVWATPTVLQDGTILVADLAGYVHALGPEGALRFRYASGCEFLLAGSVCDQTGTAYFGDPLGFVHCLSPAGLGNPTFEARRAIQARPAFDCYGNLYLCSMDREVYVFPNQARG
jgi:outer membrane protein assembly factor BamB